MTLIEALKTGKKIRRQGWTLFWLSFDDEQYQYLSMTKQDILATDWEVEPEKLIYSKEECVASLVKAFEHNNITAALKNSLIEHLTSFPTRKQFDIAWRKACRKTAGPGYDLDDVYQIIIKELGL